MKSLTYMFKEVVLPLLGVLAFFMLISWAIDPTDLISIKDKAVNYFKVPKQANAIQEDNNYFELEINPYLGDMIRCSIIEAGADAQDLGYESQKRRVCTKLCGDKYKDYHHHECKVDRIHCFCKN